MLRSELTEPPGSPRVTLFRSGGSTVYLKTCERVHKVRVFLSLGGNAAMRATSLVAGLAIVVAACGGEKKAPDQATTTTSEQQQAPAAAPAATGATHDVNMVLEGS
jgi:hypothetical protein